MLQLHMCEKGIKSNHWRSQLVETDYVKRASQTKELAYGIGPLDTFSVFSYSIDLPRPSSPANAFASSSSSSAAIAGSSVGSVGTGSTGAAAAAAAPFSFHQKKNNFAGQVDQRIRKWKKKCSPASQLEKQELCWKGKLIWNCLEWSFATK